MNFYLTRRPAMLLAALLLSAVAARHVYGDAPAKPQPAAAPASQPVGTAINLEAEPADGRLGTNDRQPTSSNWLYRAETLSGTAVTGSSGQVLGELDELVVDARSGEILYAALAVRSIRPAEKLVAIPWGSFQARRRDGELVFELDVPRKKLQMAPGFDRDQWPDVGNRAFAERVDVYFGVVVKEGDLKSKFGTDVGTLAEAPHLLRVSQLPAAHVQSADNSRAGKMESVVIDLKRQAIRYAVVGFPKVVGLRDRLFPIPWSHIKFETDDGDVGFVLNLRADAAPPAPHFSRNSWPDLRNPQWAGEVDRFYGDNTRSGDRHEERQDEDATDSR